MTTFPNGYVLLDTTDDDRRMIAQGLNSKQLAYAALWVQLGNLDGSHQAEHLIELWHDGELKPDMTEAFKGFWREGLGKEDEQRAHLINLLRRPLRGAALEIADTLKHAIALQGALLGQVLDHVEMKPMWRTTAARMADCAALIQRAEDIMRDIIPEYDESPF